MGYRSDVVCLIYPKRDSDLTADAIKLIIAAQFPEVQERFSECFEYAGDTVVFKCSDVKWYPNYSDVAAFMAMLDKLDWLDGIEYEFGRIGEDDNDVETRRSDNSEYRLGVQRSFSY